MKNQMWIEDAIFWDVIAYDIAKLLYHLEFVSIQMKKFPDMYM